MKAEVAGSIVLSMTMDEARELYRAIQCDALNARDKSERPIVELYAALSTLLHGPGTFKPPVLT